MNEKKPNIFVRVLTGLLCVFVAGICTINFLNSNAITGGLIIMICILVVLVLSESFDNFSISKIITLNRDIENKNVENSQLRTENSELRNHIVTITTSVNQKQINSFTFGTGGDMGVKPATSEEKQEEEESNNVVCAIVESTQQPMARLKRYVKYEDASIDKLLKDNDLDRLSLLRNAKFTQNNDPIATFEPIYDGYLKLKEAEIFIEIAMVSNTTIMWRDRLYIMLNKIKFYKETKNSNAYLYLIIVNNIPLQDDNESAPNMIQIRERYETYFKPAIASGLLRIVEYDKDSLHIE